MDSLRKARASRRAYVGHLGSIIRDIENMDGETSNKSQILTLEDRLSSTAAKILVADNAILDLLDDEDELTNEIAVQAETGDKVSFYKVLLSAKLTDTGDKELSSVASTPSTATASHGLPRITLPTFDGDYLNWRPFYDQFAACVHNLDIPDVQKFTYLLSSLRGKAKNAVIGIPCTSGNYESTLELLRDRFGDPALLIGLYADRILRLDAAKDNDVFSFRQCLDNFESSLREIHQLIEEVSPGSLSSKISSFSDVAVHDLLLAPLFLGKLPRSTHLEWSRRSASPREKFDLNSLLKFAKSEVEALEALDTSQGQSNHSSTSKPVGLTRNRKPLAAVNALQTSSFERICSLCSSGSNHSPFKCAELFSLSVANRRQLVKDKSLCFNCFGNHLYKNCKSKFRCRHCNYSHHSLIHQEQPTVQQESSPVDGSSTLTSKCTVHVDSCNRNVAILQTALVSVKGCSRLARVLLDTGAEESYVTQSLVEIVNPPLVETRFTRIETFGGGISDVKGRNAYIFDLSSRFQQNAMPFKLISVPRICKPTHSLSNDNLHEIKAKFAQLNLADSYESDNATLPIDILLGMDSIPSVISSGGCEKFKRLLLTPTTFGHVIAGITTSPDDSLVSVSKFYRTSMSDEISRIWNLDAIGIESPVSIETKVTINPTFKDGRYEVGLPWLDDSRPNMSFNQANLRNRSFQRLSENKQEFYSSTLEQYHTMKILEPAVDHGGNFIPHHLVQSSGKFRIVYDASAKPWRGPSLNDCLSSGPNLLSDLTAILLRFRNFNIPLVADTEKAFLMISVREEDRAYLKIAWYDLRNRLRVSRFTRVPFGLNCGPYLLLQVLHHHFSKLSDLNSCLIDRLKEGLYMDDLVTGHDTLQDVSDLKVDSQEVFRQAGMNLTGFVSVPHVHKQWSSDPAPNTKSVLGVPWSPENDILMISLEISNATSRREVASQVARIFDPLGLASPWLIRLRIFLQSLWTSCDSWDEPLSPALAEEYQNLIDESSGQMITIPRLAKISPESEIHVFADASQKAYAAVIYLKTGVEVSLLYSRCRVAPLKPKLTLPRLELMAALLASRIYHFVTQTLRIQSNGSYFWSDSMIVLSWISNPPSDVFVKNRVREIRSLTSANQWNHVMGSQNPADLPSRGIKASSLADSSEWFRGPTFLRNISPGLVSFAKKVKTPHEERPTSIGLEKFSSLRKAVRVVGWIRRFCFNSRRRQTERVTGDLSPEEESSSLSALLHHSQIAHGYDDYVSLTGGDSVSRQSPIFDAQPEWDPERKLIICTPRNGEPPLPWLPIPSPLARLIVLDTHNQLYHLGVPSTVAEIGRNYWTRRCRQYVKKNIHECTRCRRVQARYLVSPEGPLPDYRCKPARAFENTGIDHFGPMYIRNGTKVWVLLFTCAVTRSIHLEPVLSLDVKETSLAVRRFFSRRGKCSLFLSDNGKSFVVLSKVLKGVVKWNLIPPASPWWGGFWERLVGTVKRSCLKTLGKTSLSFSEWITVLNELEDRINRRPLATDNDGASHSHPLIFCSEPLLPLFAFNLI